MLKYQKHMYNTHILYIYQKIKYILLKNVNMIFIACSLIELIQNPFVK